MRKRFSRTFLLLGASLAVIVPTAGPAAADETQVCYVEVVIDQYPYVTPPQNIGGTIVVGTPKFHTEQNCIGPIGT